MKVIRQRVFEIKSKDKSGYEMLHLVEADTFISAIEVFNSYSLNNKLEIVSIAKGAFIIKPLTETIVEEL